MTNATTFLKALSLAAFAGWALVQAPDAGAASPARCAQYAQRAVAQNRQNVTMGCGLAGLNWQANYQNHYNWCLGAAPFFVDLETQRRDAGLARCAKTAGAQPPGPGGPPFPPPGSVQSRQRACAGYANAAVAQNRDNLKRNCGFRGGGWHSNYNVHYAWCMRVRGAQPGVENRARQANLRICSAKKSCAQYATTAVRQNAQNLQRRCGFRGGRWSSVYNVHYNWCAQRRSRGTARETKIRNTALARCRVKLPLAGSFRITSVVPQLSNAGVIGRIRITIEATSNRPWVIGAYGHHRYGSLWAEVTTISKIWRKPRVTNRVKKYLFSIRGNAAQTAAFVSPRLGMRVPAGRRRVTLIVSPMPRSQLTGVKKIFKIPSKIFGPGRLGCWRHFPEVRVKVFIVTTANLGMVRTATTGAVRNAPLIDVSVPGTFNVYQKC